jgi:Rieske 2Fe-2S family protein
MKRRTAFGQRMLARQHFTSPEIFEQEAERVFRGRWLFAAHSSQLASAGSFVTFEFGADSVLLVRDQQGALRAFHNFCRHRGTRLCEHSSGKLGATIQCPYHAWTYDLDGALRSAPNMSETPGFEPKDYPLIPVAWEECEGLVFVHLGQPQAPLDRALPGLRERLAPWRVSELQSVHQTVYEVEANWKLFFHNYSECYHCPNVHPHLNRLTPYKNTTNDLDEGPVLGGPMWMTNSDGSMTIGGERCAPLLPGLSEQWRGKVLYYTVFPSAFVSLHPDYVLIHRAKPIAPQRTEILCDWYFHPRAIAMSQFDPKPAIEFWDLTNRQDWDLCANAQKGINSPAFVPGPYAEIESQLAAFDREYLKAMGGGS